MIALRQMNRDLRWFFKRTFGSKVGEKEKIALRNKVLTLPITSEYPFDLELKLLRHIGIKPVMLDIGANKGTYSAILEDLVGSDCLYMFEPLPHLVKYLKQRFKNAQVYDFAISDREGEQNIQMPYIEGKRFDSRATLNKHSEPKQTGYDEVTVRLASLDSVVKKLELKSIGFIKIDVEGHELEILNGGADTFTHFKPLVLIEIESRHHKYPITKIFSKFEELGYKGYYADSKTFTLLSTNQFNTNRDQDPEHLESGNFIRYLNNFFFVHSDSENEFVEKVVSFLASEKALAQKTIPIRTDTSNDLRT